MLHPSHESDMISYVVVPPVSKLNVYKMLCTINCYFSSYLYVVMVGHHSIFKMAIVFNSHKYYRFLGHVQSSETFNGTLLILSAVK